TSIPSNIAEGPGRDSNRDFRRFPAISLGSSFEFETQLILSNSFGFISEKKFNDYTERLHELQKMIYGFRKSLSPTSKIRNLMLSLLFY
ncbi:MAG: four helix bundle protein, partial [Chlorobi bacterium]|nr:four helix bundle protein [Chlorobiota bacterium]